MAVAAVLSTVVCLLARANAGGDNSATDNPVLAWEAMAVGGGALPLPRAFSSKAIADAHPSVAVGAPPGQYDLSGSGAKPKGIRRLPPQAASTVRIIRGVSVMIEPTPVLRW